MTFAALGVPAVPLGVGTMAVIVGLRLLSVHFDWATPQPRAVARVPRLGRRTAREAEEEVL